MDVFLNSVAAFPEWKIYLTVVLVLWQGLLIAIIPEEILVLALGALWGRETVGFLPSVLFVAIGVLPANAICFWLGRRFGMGLLGAPPFRWFLRKEAVERSLSRLARYHHWIVFITRFTPLVRGPIYVAAGISKISLWDFVKMDFLAACVQIPVLLLCGRWLASNPAPDMSGLSPIALAALLGAVTVLLLRRSLSAQTERML